GTRRHTREATEPLPVSRTGEPLRATGTSTRLRARSAPPLYNDVASYRPFGHQRPAGAAIVIASNRGVPRYECVAQGRRPALRRVRGSLVVGVAAFALVGLSLAACSSNNTSTTPSSSASGGTSAPPASSLKVGMAYDVGGRGDQSFNDAAARGLDKAKSDYGVAIKELEATLGETDAQKEDRLRQLADGGSNPIIAGRFAHPGPPRQD